MTAYLDGNEDTVMNHAEFRELTEKGVVLLDGATGSNLRKAGMPVGVCTELWALEHPEIILQLQSDYVDAGSQIVYAPTFTANRVNLTSRGLESRLEELNRELVRLSKRAVGNRALVAGDITTTGKNGKNYDDLLEIYKEQISILADAGADLIIAETMLTLEETAAAVEAAKSVCDLPIMCSMTMEADGTLLFGGSVIEAVETLQEMGADAVGLNCSVGPDQLEAVVSSMKQAARIPLLVKPNAGLPTIDEFGTAHYSMSAADFAIAMKKLVWRGARIVGGCCGTTPEYIRALKDALKK